MNWITKRTGLSVLLLVVLATVFAFPVIAATLQATIGGQDSSGNYHFTVDSDGVMDGASGSRIKAPMVGKQEILASTLETAVAADNGLTFITGEVAATTTWFTLPDCGSTVLELSFVAATDQRMTIDTYATTEYINYLTLDAGDAIDSAGAKGDSTTLRCYKTDYWIPVEMGSSAFTDGGAN